MYRISQVAETFAGIDSITGERAGQLEKLLRNTTQRHSFSPSARDGRADLYSVETVCALRFAERMDAFGIARHVLDDFLRFMQSSPTLQTRVREAGGVARALSTIEEAVERARAGEDLKVGLALNRDRRVVPRAWFALGPIDDDAQEILTTVYRGDESSVILTLDAGRLIREILEALPPGSSAQHDKPDH